ncbi:MAG: class I SAM-dependent methyltransferase [Acidimicrobiales bacterium]
MIRSILNNSSVFDRWQSLVGAEGAKRWFTDTYVTPRNPIRVLEVGCGTGALCRYLSPSVDYLGVDIDDGYVHAASRAFPNRRFERADIGDLASFESIGRDFDMVVAFGVLHHLDDSQARRCLRGCAEALTSKGLFFSVDPCHHQNEKPVEFLMKRFDRGRFIRSADSFRDLVAESFTSAEVEVESHQMLMSYRLAIVTGRAEDRSTPS